MNYVALRPEHLNILSICTGGGGLDLGIELAIPSARTVCMVEREAFAVASLVAAMEQGLLHPSPVWSDARTFNGRAWRGAVDGLIGGIPCQPHSLAGKKRGQHDERDLWSDTRRRIVQSRVWFVFIENVGGMLSAGDDEIAGAERVFRDLHKLGFETEGGLFTAAEVGASHQRERIFILAVADRHSEHGYGTRIGGARRRGQSPDRSGEVPGVGLADAYGERLEGVGSDTGAEGRSDAGRSVGLCDGTALVDAKGIGHGEGRSEPSIRSGRDAPAGAGGPMGNAIGSGHDGRPDEPVGRQIKRIAAEGAGFSDERAMGNPEGLVGAHIIDRHGQAGQRVVSLDRPTGGNGHGGSPARDLSREREDATASWLRPLFAPGPADLSSWCDTLASAPELEPAFRRVADGLASGVDLAQCWSRVDRLRMLGNGVVPLQAAYALRTLVTRLAARGSAGAARLVRMMEAAE